MKKTFRVNSMMMLPTETTPKRVAPTTSNIVRYTYLIHHSVLPLCLLLVSLSHAVLPYVPTYFHTYCLRGHLCHEGRRQQYTIPTKQHHYSIHILLYNKLFFQKKVYGIVVVGHVSLISCQVARKFLNQLSIILI